MSVRREGMPEVDEAFKVEALQKLTDQDFKSGSLAQLVDRRNFIWLYASMVKLVYTRALGARAERLAGSSPVAGTK